MSRKYVKIGKLGKTHGVYGALRFLPIFRESKALSLITYVFLGLLEKGLRVHLKRQLSLVLYLKIYLLLRMQSA